VRAKGNSQGWPGNEGFSAAREATSPRGHALVSGLKAYADAAIPPPGPGGLGFTRARPRPRFQLGRAGISQPLRTRSALRGYISGHRRPWYRAPSLLHHTAQHCTYLLRQTSTLLTDEHAHCIVAHELHRTTKHTVPAHYRPAAPHCRKHLPRHVFPGDQLLLCPAAALLAQSAAHANTSVAPSPLGIV
jgi:hypothetical protein